MSPDVADPPIDIPPVTPPGETNRFAEDFLENLETDENERPEEVPPRRQRGVKVNLGKGEKKPKKPLPRWKDGAISDFAEKIYKASGAALQLNHDPEIRLIGQQLIECAYQCGQAWEKVAKRNELVRRIFDRLMTTSDLGELFWAHVPIFVPVLRRFGPLRATFNNIQEQFDEEFQDAA